MNLKPNFFLLVIRRKEDFVHRVNESAGGGGEVKHRRSMHEVTVEIVVVGMDDGEGEGEGIIMSIAFLKRNGESC